MYLQSTKIVKGWKESEKSEVERSFQPQFRDGKAMWKHFIKK
jgi:hypothetical protein